MILLLHHFGSSCSLQFAIGVSFLFQITPLKAEMQIFTLFTTTFTSALE